MHIKTNESLFINSKLKNVVLIHIKMVFNICFLSSIKMVTMLVCIPTKYSILKFENIYNCEAFLKRIKNYRVQYVLKN